MMKTTTRPITWQKYQPGRIGNNIMKNQGPATFLQFGIGNEGADGYPCTVAIIELPDGSVRAVPVEDITFTDKKCECCEKAEGEAVAK
jgi:hypothetical protein